MTADDEAHAAIGRYIVAFSHLIYWMRTEIAKRLMRHGEGLDLVETVLASAQPRQIADGFFDLCEATMPRDQPSTDPETTEPVPHKDDLAIARRLRLQVLREIEQRNDIAHGDWWVSEEIVRLPTLVRLKAGRKAGIRKIDSLSVSDLNEITESLWQLVSLVSEFANIALRERPDSYRPRIRDRFTQSGPKGKGDVVVQLKQEDDQPPPSASDSSNSSGQTS